MDIWLKKAQALQEEMVGWRRFLHENAESGFALQTTEAFVRERLEEMGYAVKKCGKVGLVALAGEVKKSGGILLRADMDGLPMQEQTDLPFASKTGNMHACGHDMHTAMLLGAAKLLKTAKLEGCVKLVFQGGEECFQGALDMIENGVLKNPTSARAFSLHVLSASPFPVGRVIVGSKGCMAPAADTFSIRVKGKGCHGSTPYEGIDCIAVSARILLGLQNLAAREIAQEHVLTVGVFQGGVAPNVLPDTTVLQGTIRSFDENTREKIKKRVAEIAKNTARAYHATAEINFENGCPILQNEGGMSALSEECAIELLGKKRVLTTKMLGENNRKGGGSEDFAYFSQKIPSVMVMLPAGEPKNGFIYPQHHPKTCFDEEVLPIGAALYTLMGIKGCKIKNNKNLS